MHTYLQALYNAITSYTKNFAGFCQYQNLFRNITFFNITDPQQLQL